MTITNISDVERELRAEIARLTAALAERPAPRKQLTKEQIKKFYGGDSPIVLQIIRDTEAAHGIKEFS